MVIYTSRKSRCSSAGRALPWGGRGRRFKSCHLDQKKQNRPCVYSAFSYLMKILNLPSTRPARRRRGVVRGSPKRACELWGFAVVCRRFKSCHLDQGESKRTLLFLLISICSAFWTICQNSLFLFLQIIKFGFIRSKYNIELSNLLRN